MKRTALVVVVVAFLSAVVAGQTGTKNGEWSTYGGDLGNTRYAPLDQITAANFNALEVAWRFKTDNLGPRLEFNLQSTPLMVKGVLYSTGGTRRAVVALDAATGEQLWMHSENEGPRGAAAPRQLSGRGLAYWSDGNEERILYVTPGYQLVALDAKTGNRIPGFGTNGIVDLKQNLDQTIDLLSGEIGLHATPVVARNVVIVGAAHRSGGVPTGKTNVKGYVRGFDVRTGKRLWIFHTIPEPGEFGNETWDKDSWVYTGNAGVWAQISVDEQLGLAYLPVESPTGDYFGGPRPGNGLFGETLVAVDLQTGKRKWHYQLVHHGIWDMDIPCPPILLDVTINGRTIKAVAQPTKQAFLYVFNRETGEPLWPIVEKPVEKGTVPGEWYSPTQPFPTRPAAYETQGLVIDDLINFTPELRAEAEKIVSRYKLGPIFTPPVASALPGPLATLAVATAGGGTNWPGGSFDPGDADPLRVVEQGPQRARSRAATRCDEERSGVRAGQRRDRRQNDRRFRCERRPGWRRRGRRRTASADGPRPAAGEAALRPDQRDRHEAWRDPLAGGARRDAGQRPQQSGAEGPDDPADRTHRHRRSTGDEDAARSRARPASVQRHPARAARCCVPTTRPAARKPVPCTSPRRKPDRP